MLRALARAPKSIHTRTLTCLAQHTRPALTTASILSSPTKHRLLSSSTTPIITPVIIMSNDKNSPVDQKKGSWQTSIAQDGAFKRRETVFRQWVRASPGPDDLPAAAGRYHLYVSYACPWAHRTLITRALKGLTGAISVSVVDHFLGEGGWRFMPSTPGATEDHVFGAERLSEIYQRSNPDHTSHFTVPILLDKETGKIVNNESSEILRMLTVEFNEFCETDEQRAIDLYPEELRAEIEAINLWVYPQINNGVYRAGFATKQEPYETASNEVFEALARAEQILSKTRYLTGSRITEADVRLLVTLLRFDPVYHFHFRLQQHRLIDFPNVWAFTRDLYQNLKGVRETTNFDHIVKHYLLSHKSINPNGIIPISPPIDWDEPVNRDNM
jgi:putative glutathione S-transferase